jgi:hypothetical protein
MTAKRAETTYILQLKRNGKSSNHGCNRKEDDILPGSGERGRNIIMTIKGSRDNIQPEHEEDKRRDQCSQTAGRITYILDIESRRSDHICDCRRSRTA